MPFIQLLILPMIVLYRSKMLKSIVPSIILRTCLDDMVDQHNSNPFAEESDDDNDDDDDEGKPKKKKKHTSKKKSTDSSDEFAGSLRLKEGRNVQNSLYYVDHSKLANEGNGLLPEVKNDLICESQKSKAELDHFGRQLKSITVEASQLESEPKNEALIVELANLEKTLEDMSEKITQLRSHAVSKFVFVNCSLLCNVLSSFDIISTMTLVCTQQLKTKSMYKKS